MMQIKLHHHKFSKLSPIQRKVLLQFIDKKEIPHLIYTGSFNTFFVINDVSVSVIELLDILEKKIRNQIRDELMSEIFYEMREASKYTDRTKEHIENILLILTASRDS